MIKALGSFTGIRIGIATALGLRDSLHLKIVGISSLEALCYNVKKDGLICSLIDARNDNVYFSLYKLENNNYTQLEDFYSNNINIILQKIEKYHQQITFIGDGSIVHKKLILEKLSESTFSEYNDLSSYSLGLAGYNAYLNKKNEDIIPLYLRPSRC